MAVNLISADTHLEIQRDVKARLACYGCRDPRVWGGEDKAAKKELFQIHLLAARQHCTTSAAPQKPLSATWHALACFD